MARKGRPPAPARGDAGGPRARPACRETACLHHDGRACAFPWIEPPADEPLDRAVCRNVLLAVPDGYWARMSALF